MTLTLMHSGHLGQMAALEQVCFSCPWSKTMLAGELENPHARYIVAEDGGEVLGYMGMYIVEDQGFVSNIAVSPHVRRQGIASELMREQICYACDNGVREIMLEVRASNTSAIELYKRFGFFCAGMRPRYYERPTEDAILMNLEVTEAEQ